MAAGKLVGDAAIYGGAWRAHRRRLDRGIWKDFEPMTENQLVARVSSDLHEITCVTLADR
jgi:hypothetical protein